MHDLQSETINGRRRWGRYKELPFSRTLAWSLLKRNLITSVKYVPPGSKKGVVLIDLDSVDRYLEQLSKEQGTFVPTPVTEAQS
jgi:hypothetical protein